MESEPIFASLGRKAGDIDVRLSHRIVTLFSEGLYKSPNKAVEELVANSFDAGAENVHVLTSLGVDDETIAVIDDGDGMDAKGLQRHWMVGRSNKRKLKSPPRGRRQIGKFGIGKLATYVLANRLTHVSKCGRSYYSASMDFGAINNRAAGEVEGEQPITIPLRRLTAEQARQAVDRWAGSAAFQRGRMPLFGSGSPASWTVSIMSDLKPMAADIRAGRLRWILRTALPLRPDFNVWLDGEKLGPSKADRAPFRRWIIGKDMEELGRDAPAAKKSTDRGASRTSEHRFGLDVEGLGRITGYAEAYDDALAGKSDEWGRSNGFFVYVRGRLVNEEDGHFGIRPNMLRHGTFSRFRAVVHMDRLDDVLRSSREAVGDGEALGRAQGVLQSIFNTVRADMDEHDKGGGSDAMLARRVSAGPASLARRPIAALARAVAEGKAQSFHLHVPTHESADRLEEALASLDASVMNPEAFIRGRRMDAEGDPEDVVAKFDVGSRLLRLNSRHPFVTVFDEEFASQRHSLPLELLVMKDVINEARMYQDGADPEGIEDAVLFNDRVLRHLAHASGRNSPSSVAAALEGAAAPRELERCACDALRSLGFGVRQMGKAGEPDGVAEAVLAAGSARSARGYKVSIEAKSKKDGRAVPAKDVDVSAVARHCREHGCDHAVVVGPAFQGEGRGESALATSISAACGKGAGRITITLIAARDLARLVRLRPVKQVGLEKIRDLFSGRMMPGECRAWVDSIAGTEVRRPEYRRIIEAIAAHQRELPREPVYYSALHTRLSKMDPPIEYDHSREVAAVCRAMDQMSEGAIWAHRDRVELDQSVENAVVAIDNAIRECEDDRPDAGDSVGRQA